MKTIIAGSRGIINPLILLQAVKESDFDITEVFCGLARGVDSLGELWALTHDVPVRYFPADWAKYGRSAGYRRNEEMAREADSLIAIWDGSSPGTKHMINLAEKHGVTTYTLHI